MISICSNSPLAAPFINKTKLSGELKKIYAPFVFFGGIETMSSLSTTNSLIVSSVLSSDGVITIAIPHLESTRDSVACLSSLSGMNEITETHIISTASGINSYTNIYGEISDKVQNSITVLNTLGDSAVSATINILTPFSVSALNSSLVIAIPHSTAKLVKDSLTVIGDGIDITSKLKDGKISLFGNNSPMSLNAVFGSLCNIPDKIVFKINAISYSFMTISAVTSDKGVSIEAQSSDSVIRRWVSYDYKKKLRMPLPSSAISYSPETSSSLLI